MKICTWNTISRWLGWAVLVQRKGEKNSWENKRKKKKSVGSEEDENWGWEWKEGEETQKKNIIIIFFYFLKGEIF